MNYDPALVRIIANTVRDVIVEQLDTAGRSSLDMADELSWLSLGRRVVEAVDASTHEPAPKIPADMPDVDHDPVHAPAHYRQLPNGIEVIDITENLDFCLGNVVKYTLRADHKGEPVQDLEKARWYLDRAIARRKGKES